MDAALSAEDAGLQPDDQAEVFGIIDKPRDSFFNPWRVPATRDAAEFVEAVIRDVQAHEERHQVRQRKRRALDEATFRATITAIVCDLVHAHLREEESGFVISRSFQHLGHRGRYRAPAHNKKLPDMLDVLATPELAILTQELGYTSPVGRGQRTRLFPGAGLRRRLVQNPLGFDDFVEDRAEVIILKAEKAGHWDSGEWLDYEDCGATIWMRGWRRSGCESGVAAG